MSIIFGNNGDNTLDGTKRNDLIIAGGGDDTVNAGDGNDLVISGKGDDVVDPGAGNDIVFAGRGNDTVIHVESENLGSREYFNGGAGQDTLHLVVTQSTFDSAVFQSELATFQAQIDQNGSASGLFSTLGIDFRSFETIEVVIEDDGNQPPDIAVLDPTADTEGNEGESDIVTLSVADFVTIDDPDPDDIPVPYAGGLALQSASGPEPVGGLGALFSIEQGTGLISYDRSDFDYLAAGEEVIASFVFDASSGPDILPLLLTVTIQGENDAPVVSVVDAGTTNEDAQPVQINLLSTASDVDASDVLSVQAIIATDDLGNPVAFTDNSDGTIDIDPGQYDALGAGESRTVTVAYEVFDGTTAVANTATLLVEGRNDAPVVWLRIDSRTDEDVAPVHMGLLAGVRDADANDTLSVQSIVATDDLGNPVGFVDNSNGTIKIDPGQFNDLGVGESRTVTVTYEVFDGTTAVTNTTTLLVEGRNDAPLVSIVNGGTTDEDAAPVQIDLLATASDVDTSDTLSVQAIVATDDLGNPVGFTDNGDGTIAIDPAQYNALAEGDSRTVTVTYEVFDGTIAVANSATLLVEGRNDAPVAVDDSFQIGENTNFSGNVLADNLNGADSDIEGDTLAVVAINGNDLFGSSFTLASGAVLEIFGSGSFDYATKGAFSDLAPGEIVTDGFSYTISDGYGGFDTADVVITVTGDLNAPPVAVNDGFEVLENRTVIIAPLSNDSDDGNEALSIVAIDGQAIAVGETVILSDGAKVTLNTDDTITYDPDGAFDLVPGWLQPVSFTYDVADASGNVATAEVFGTIRGNEAPETQPDSADILENETVTLDPLANDTDPEGDPLTITRIDGFEVLPGETLDLALGGKARLNEDGTITFDPDGDFSPNSGGEVFAPFSYTVSDDAGNSVTEAIDIRILPNEAPVAASDSFTLVEKGTTIIDLLANDSDPEGDSIALVNVNGFPLSLDEETAIGPGVSLTLNTDGTITVIADPSLDVEPGAPFNSQFSYEIIDSAGNSAIGDVQFQIIADLPPVVGDDAVTVPDSTTVTFDPLANDNDPEGGTLTYESIAGLPLETGDTNPLPSGARITLNYDGTLTYDPDGAIDPLPGDTVLDQFEYIVRDPFGNATQGSVTVSVTHNDAPVVVDDAFSVVTGETATSDILGNDSDPDGDALTITRIESQDISIGQTITLNIGALVTLNPDQSITFDPNGNFNPVIGSPDQRTITYEVSDGAGQTSQGSFVVTIFAPNVAPTLAGSLSATVAEGGTFAITEGELSFADPDDDTVTFTATDIFNGMLLVNGVEQSTFTNVDLATPGAVTFVHDGTETPAAGFTVSVEDGDEDGSAPDTATFSFDVTPVNEAPTVTLAGVTTNLAEDTDTSGRIKVADIVVTDADAGTNELALSGADAALFEIDGAELFLSADAVLDFETNPVLDVTVEVDDASTGSTPDDSASLSIAIGDVNEAPSVTLVNTVTEFSQGTDTGERIKVAEIVVEDDVPGVNDLALVGADAALFEIDGFDLFLKAGTLLDYATNPVLDVTVEIDDSAIGSTPDDSVSLSIMLEESPSLIVTTTEDVVDDSDGKTSLREAIAYANSAADADGNGEANDTITFASGAGEAFESGGTIFLGGNGQLQTTSNVTIIGDVDNDGSPDVTINANSAEGQNDAADRVLQVREGTTVLEGLKITGGNATGSSGGGDGGGIEVSANAAVVIENSEITDNEANMQGGGIFALDASVTLNNSLVSDNDAVLDGGGIAAILFGVFADGALEMTNTTVSGNSTTRDGGGVFVEFGSASITSTTISGNTASFGGGLSVSDDKVTLTNTLVLGNNGGEIDRSHIDNGGNLIGNGSIQVSDVFSDVDPSTGGGLIADNGGPVQTIALKADPANPALDRGQPTALTSDANGGDRNVDVPGIDNGGSVDAGAVELQVEAPSLYVTTTADIVDELDGETSLREAIAYANSVYDADNDGLPEDTIEFAAGPGEAFENGGSIFLGDNGMLEISSDITINGDLDDDGNPDVTLDANTDAGQTDASDRVLLVSNGQATLIGLTITGGQTHAEGGGIRIDSEASLLIEDSIIAENEATNGGGIANAGTLQVDRSEISDNKTGGQGGGLHNSGYAELNNSSIEGNEANQGGGISNTELLVVDQSLISGNEAGDDGGGMLNAGYAGFTGTTIKDNDGFFGGGIANAGTLEVGQSLISGNTAFGDGGGLYNKTRAELVNTTIEGNKADDGTGGVVTSFALATTLTHVTITGNGSSSQNGEGSGLSSEGGPAIDVVNSIVVGNGNNDNGGAINDLGGNLIDDGTIDAASVFANVDPATGGGLLADNGGPVQTVALKADMSNPALDLSTAPADTLDADGDGDTDEALPIDAQGNARGQDVSGVNNGGTVDAGAVELQAIAMAAPLATFLAPDASVPGQETTDEQSDWEFFISKDSADAFVIESSDGSDGPAMNSRAGDDIMQPKGLAGLIFDLLDTDDDGHLSAADGRGDIAPGQVWRFFLDEFDAMPEFRDIHELGNSDLIFV